MKCAIFNIWKQHNDTKMEATQTRILGKKKEATQSQFICTYKKERGALCMIGTRCKKRTQYIYILFGSTLLS